MERGRLRHKATIERPEKTADGMGGFTEEWHVFAVRQASIWRRRSGEHYVDGKLVHAALWDIRITYVPNLKSGYRLLVEDSVFEILSVMPTEFKKRYVDLVCRVIE